jgi:hypothetical protein
MLCEEEKTQNVSIVAFLCLFIFALVFLVLGLLPYVEGNWSTWKQATCMPNQCFCEKPRNTLLQQPSNTWSNMGFVIAGLVVIIQSSRVDIKKDLFSFYAVVYGFADIALGITSAFYHLSLTFVGQFVDNLGMFFVICWCICWNAARLSKPFRKTTPFFVLYFGMIGIAAYINLYLPEIRRYAFAGSVVILLLSQILVDFIVKPWTTGIDYFYFGAAFVCLIVAFGIWNIDLQRIYCDENSLFQGHAVWHSLDALATYYLYLFYKSEVKKPETKFIE